MCMQFADSKGGRVNLEMFDAFLSLECKIFVSTAQLQMLWRLLLPTKMQLLGVQEQRIDVRDWLGIVGSTAPLQVHYKHQRDDYLAEFSVEQLKKFPTKVQYGEKRVDFESDELSHVGGHSKDGINKDKKVKDGNASHKQGPAAGRLPRLRLPRVTKAKGRRPNNKAPRGRIPKEKSESERRGSVDDWVRRVAHGIDKEPYKSLYTRRLMWATDARGTIPDAKNRPSVSKIKSNIDGWC